MEDHPSIGSRILCYCGEHTLVHHGTITIPEKRLYIITHISNIGLHYLEL